MNTQIFEWLGKDDAGVGYHLHALHLVWSEAGPDHDVAVFRAAAEQLAAVPAYWAEILLAENWRFTLAGLTCLLASGRREFRVELEERLAAGSYVAPQLAVALGLLHGAAATERLAGIATSPTASPEVKWSAAAVLRKLRGEVPATAASPEEQAVTEAVERHWAFWAPRLQTSAAI